MADESLELCRLFKGTIVSRTFNGKSYPLIVDNVFYSRKRECDNPFKDLVFSCGHRSKKGIITVNYHGEFLNLFPRFSGARNYKSGVLYTKIHPIRQWRRGWSIYNEGIKYNFLNVEKVDITDPFCAEFFDLCYSILNPNYPSALDSNNSVLKGERYCSSFSENWIIFPDSEEETTLTYKMRKVGSIIDNKAVLLDKCLFLKEELSNFIEVSNG